MRRITETKEIQSIMLEILKYIDGVCKDNNLKYYLYAGTLLGAIRHKGFIPWDDDLDICMPRSDYNKLIKIMKKSDNKKYSLKCIENSKKDYNYCFGKMVDNNTVVKEIGKFQGEELGVWVDIFPLDGVGNNLEKAKHIVEHNRKYVRQILLLEVGKKMNKKGKLLHLVGRKKLNQIFKHNLKKPSFYDSDYVADITNLEFEEVIFEKKCFIGERTCLFEGMEISIPSESENLLEKIYGDYMKLPPEEERVSPHNCEVWVKE